MTQIKTIMRLKVTAELVFVQIKSPLNTIDPSSLNHVEANHGVVVHND